MKETKSFIIRTVIKLFVLSIFILWSRMLVQSPVISNEVALGQIRNDAAGFMVMNVYNNIKPYISAGFSIIAAIILVNILIGVYKFIDRKIKENKEN